MKDHPILFTGEMVRAILDDRKTQTRRVIRLNKFLKSLGRPLELNDFYVGPSCPYGKPGDRLWVRETWAKRADATGIAYKAGPYPEDVKHDIVKWKPSIHMFRWASRILLEVTDVRVERVQEISEQDARADSGKDRCCMSEGHDARVAFHGLWDSINAKRGFEWDKNPWVWVVEFKRIKS